MSHPLAQIFPRATGGAARTVAAHTAPQEVIFHAGWFCPFAQRVWITLEEKGIPYQYKEVNPYKKEKHFLDINPKGLVPAIEYHGKALQESLVLCEFLEDAYPNHTPHLLPVDSYERAYARIWIDNISKTIVPAFFRLLTAQEPEKQKSELDEFNNALAAYASKIQGPYFLGDNFSLVDIAIAPFVMRDYLLVDYRGYRRETVGKDWETYAKTIEKKESVLDTMSERDKYMTMYGHYLRDEAQSEITKAIHAGRALP